MPDVLVYVLEHDGTFNPGSLGTLAAGARVAAQLGGEAHAIVVGDPATLTADALATLGGHGAARVLRAAGTPGLAGPGVDAMAAAIAARGYGYALFGGGLLGFEIGAGLAARLDAGVVMEVTGLRVVDGALVAERPILGDSQVSQVEYRSPVGVAIGRVNAFPVQEPSGASAPVEDVDAAPSAWAEQVTLVSRGEQRGVDVAIEDADVIVAGGRGLGSAEGFEALQALAATLGGTVAATRAVVDAGWYPYAGQIGQTGKTVSPKLYLAAGISGAIQHKVGMQGSEHVVAINSDANAPILEWADLGVVGDLNAIVPKLTDAIRARKGA